MSQAFMSTSSHFPLSSLASAHLTDEDTEAESSDRISPGHTTEMKLPVFAFPIYEPTHLFSS